MLDRSRVADRRGEMKDDLAAGRRLGKGRGVAYVRLSDGRTIDAAVAAARATPIGTCQPGIGRPRARASPRTTSSMTTGSPATLNTPTGPPGTMTGSRQARAASSTCSRLFLLFARPTAMKRPAAIL